MKSLGVFQVQNFSHTEHNSQINFSELSNFFHENPYRSFSVKYVATGCEIYVANGVKYKVAAGEYLLANAETEGSILVKENQFAKGICIDLSNNLIAEVLGRGWHQEELFELRASNFFNSNQFLENKYVAKTTALGYRLQQLGNHYDQHQNQLTNFDNDFYFHLIECLIEDYAPIYKQLQQVPSKKLETKKDLWRKTNEGRNIMNDLFLTPFSIRQIAQAVGLSEYYFFRLFKTLYKISPYQYLLNKRLQHATMLLQQKELSITEIAQKSALGDIYNFSKMYKKAYGIPPSAVR